MSITIDIKLHKDCTRCILGCITFNLEGLSLIQHHEDWFFGEAFLHFVKGLLGSIIPNKWLVFLEELVHGLSKFREFPNKTSIKVSESKEEAYLFNILGDWPVMDSIELGGVHHHLAFFDNKAKVFNLCFAKFAFQWFAIKVSFLEAFENVFGESFEIFFVFGKDKDVIHVSDAKPFLNFIFESVIHHCLEC